MVDGEGGEDGDVSVEDDAAMGDNSHPQLFHNPPSKAIFSQLGTQDSHSNSQNFG